MDITIRIDENLFEEPIKEAVARIVHNLVRESVQKHIYTYQDQINKSVEVYLAKRLTDETVKKHIDLATASIIEDRLRND